MDIDPVFLILNLIGAIVPLAGTIALGIRLRDTARLLGVVGCVLMSVTGLLYVVLGVLPAVLGDNGSDLFSVFRPISTVAGIVSSIGLILLIMAAVSGRRSEPLRPGPPQAAPPPWSPPPPPPGAYPPPN